MSQGDDLRGIVGFLKDANRSDSAIEKPAQIDDTKSSPLVKEQAGRFYASQLLKKNTPLTPEESKYLGEELAKYAREERGK
jgi:hypothetical protein